MTKTFFIETLGCAKNAVDSEKAAQGLLDDGFVPTDSADKADLVVVNTCAFIDAAREESINTTLELSQVKKASAKLVVTGCMAQRYENELREALPEADAIVGFANEGNIAEQVFGQAFEPVMFKSRPKGVRDLLEMKRPSTDLPWAYLKVAEGCNRNCAFCAIPTFRGKQRSRSVDSILDEARGLVESGVKEIVLVAQDIAWYGRDDKTSEANLATIMREIDHLKADGLIRQRLVYIYPSELRGELLETILTLDTSIPYFDLSLQHANAELLRHMKRPGSSEKFFNLINEIRRAKPEAVFRSNFIVGFPGEKEEHHDELLSFVEKANLLWTGFFPYSHERDTTAFNYQDQIDPDLAQTRVRELQRVQDEVTQKLLLETVGQNVTVMVDSLEDGISVSRGFDSAPEIDGVIKIENEYAIGETLEVQVTGVEGVDRYANVVNK